VLGQVVATGILPTRRGLRVFQAVIKDASGLLEIAWPGLPDPLHIRIVLRRNHPRLP
jgi:hypothetical protein